MGISPQVLVGQRIMPAQVTVVATKPVAPVVADAPLLRTPRRRLDDSLVGFDAKVAVAQADDRLAGVIRDPPAEQAARAVDPAIQTIFEAVDSRLKIVG